MSEEFNLSEKRAIGTNMNNFYKVIITLGLYVTILINTSNWIIALSSLGLVLMYAYQPIEEERDKEYKINKYAEKPSVKLIYPKVELIYSSRALQAKRGVLNDK